MTGWLSARLTADFGLKKLGGAARTSLRSVWFSMLAGNSVSKENPIAGAVLGDVVEHEGMG